MEDEDADRRFSASDVREVADISYRQLNDWDQKGAVPPSREKASGWRRFTERELFVLLVCQEMRKKYGVPVESLKYVTSCMVREGANHFAAAIEIMALFHMPVFLLTDFETTFIMDHPFELSDYLLMGLGSNHQEAAFVLLKVNPLVNRILARREKPIEIKESHDGYDLLHQLRGQFSTRTSEEYEVLKLLRDESFARVDVHLRHGEIKKAYAHEELGEMSDADVLDLLKSEDFQNITVTLHNGRIVRLQRELTFKLSEPGASRTHTDRKDPGNRVRQRRKADQ